MIYTRADAEITALTRVVANTRDSWRFHEKARPRRAGHAVKRCGPTFPWGRMNGSGGRTRTADPVVNSHLLYRLSYAGMD